MNPSGLLQSIPLPVGSSGVVIGGGVARGCSSHTIVQTAPAGHGVHPRGVGVRVGATISPGVGVGVGVGVEAPSTLTVAETSAELVEGSPTCQAQKYFCSSDVSGCKVFAYAAE